MAKPKFVVINTKTGEQLSAPVSKSHAEDIADILREMEHVPAKVVAATSADVRSNPTSYVKDLVDSLVGNGRLTKEGIRAAYAVRTAKTKADLRAAAARLVHLAGDLIEEPGDAGYAVRELSEIAEEEPETRENPTPSWGLLGGIGIALAALAAFAFSGSAKATGPLPGPGDKKEPPGGRPPGPEPRQWVDTPVVSPLTQTLVVIGDGSADLLVQQMAPFLPKGKKILSLKTGTSLSQMTDTSRKALDSFLANRPIAANPFGLSTDVFLLSHSSNVDPADLVNEIRPLLTKNDPIVWVPPFGNEEMLAKLQSTFAEARANGNRVVGIIPTAVNDTPGWGKSVLADITAVNGIPEERRI